VSAETEPRRLHPATLLSSGLRSMPQMAAAGAGYAAVVAREGFGRILLFAALAALIAAVGAAIGWWRFRYQVRASEIAIQSGVFHRKRRVIPFDRVQDIAIEQRLLARLFGTARVRIETGGSAADEGDLNMIALADAHRLRDRIRRWRGAHAAEGAAAEEPEVADEPVLFEMGLGRVLLSGIFNFSLFFLALIFAALQYLDDFGLVDPEAWLNPEEAEAVAGRLSLAVLLSLAALVLLLGILSGVLRTLARDYGFRLTRSEAGLRRRRGLLTLSEVVIPLRRTQVAVIRGGMLERAFGWSSLAFQTLGADPREGGVQTAAPFARPDEIEPVLAEPGFPRPPEPASFRRLPLRAIVRRTLPTSLLALLAGIVALLVDARFGYAAVVLAVIALGAGLRWRRHRHLIGETALFVTGGLFTKRLWIIPFEKAQAIFVTRSPLQRTLGLASLLVDTAGAPMVRTPEIVDLDAAEADALSRDLLSRFHRARAALRR
jgi:putative membrane protein